MILDTTFLIDVLRGNEEALEWEEEFDEGEEEPTISSISIMEIWEGALRSKKMEEELEKIKKFLEGLSCVAFDSKDGRTSGEIRAALAEKGTPIEVEDVMIAATAINSGQKILTKNPDHFERIENLTVETY